MSTDPRLDAIRARLVAAPEPWHDDLAYLLAEVDKARATVTAVVRAAILAKHGGDA